MKLNHVSTFLGEGQLEIGVMKRPRYLTLDKLPFGIDLECFFSYSEDDDSI